MSRARVVFLSLSLPLIACHEDHPATQATPPQPSSPQAHAVGGPRTHVQHDDLAIDLPGVWTEAPGPRDGGYNLRSDREEVVVALFPPVPGQTASASVPALADAQKRGLSALCHRGLVVGTPERATRPTGAMRVHVTCDEPHVIATFVAVPAGDKVLSYEHYWYGVPGFSTELDQADEEILDTFRVKSSASECPASVLAADKEGKGACVEPAVLGEERAVACRRAFEARGWSRDATAEATIGGSTGKTLLCYRNPL